MVSRLTCVVLVFDAFTANFAAAACAVLFDVGCRDVRSAANRVVADEGAGTGVLADGTGAFFVILVPSGFRALFAAAGLCELGCVRGGKGNAVCALDRWVGWGC